MNVILCLSFQCASGLLKTYKVSREIQKNLEQQKLYSISSISLGAILYLYI